MKQIDFTSVHDYLDLLFKDTDPSREEIIQAKKDYWRAYNTNLKRRKRKSHSILQIVFSKKEYALLKERLEEDRNVSGYIHDLVLRHIENNQDFAPNVNTALIEQQLFLIVEYLRELLEFENIDTESIDILETHIKTLETVIHDSI